MELFPAQRRDGTHGSFTPVVPDLLVAQVFSNLGVKSDLGNPHPWIDFDWADAHDFQSVLPVEAWIPIPGSHMHPNTKSAHGTFSVYDRNKVIRQDTLDGVHQVEFSRTKNQPCLWKRYFVGLVLLSGIQNLVLVQDYLAPQGEVNAPRVDVFWVEGVYLDGTCFDLICDFWSSQNSTWVHPRTYTRLILGLPNRNPDMPTKPELHPTMRLEVEREVRQERQFAEMDLADELDRLREEAQGSARRVFPDPLDVLKADDFQF